MNGKFSHISEVLSGLIDLIFAGLLWLLCSLPVLTLGSSTTALYYTVMKCIRHNRGRVAPTFFHGFRSNFRTATLIWLLFLLWLIIGVADAYSFGRMGYGPGTVLYSLSRLFFLPPLLIFPWVFSYISRFENSVIGTLKFTGWLTLRYFGRSVLLSVELVGFLLISWLLPQIFPLLPAAICLLTSLTIEPVFRPFQPETGDSSVDAWYNE